MSNCMMPQSHPTHCGCSPQGTEQVSSAWLAQLREEYRLFAEECKRLQIVEAGLRTALQTSNDHTKLLMAERDTLRAEIEALRKDAELFRQLRDLPDELLGANGVPCVAVPEGPRSGRYVSGPDLDAAMAARGDTPEYVCPGCGAKGWTASCDQCIPY